MPVYHILECDVCKKRTEPIILNGASDGGATMGGGNQFVCDESWQNCPDGWNVSPLEYHGGKIDSPDFRRIAPIITCPKHSP